ncbi:MAG: CBS domain-containing protein [Candidatus Omnitrophica bacterium]|nr:CBS domain-containing protein [Candidatus Omnitrophota bacterium]
MISILGVMTRNVITVKADTPIYDALQLFLKHEISGMPVVNDSNEVIGILSEKDVLKILVDENRAVSDIVEDYMTRDVISFKEEDDAVAICKFFLSSTIRRVPITKNGKLCGIISRRDIVSLILDAERKISDFRFD